MLFSIENDIGLYQKLGDQAASVFSGDFEAQAWEISQSSKHYHFSYRILRQGDLVKLVHKSDFLLDKDILEAVDPTIRNGLEFEQISKAREELISAEIDTSLVLISPKKILPDDPNYPRTLISVARKIDEGAVEVSQFQFDLDLRGCARFLNWLCEMEVVGQQPTLAELIGKVQKFPGRISDEEVLFIAGQICGEDFGNEVGVWQTSGMPAEEAGLKYLTSIKQGLTKEELERQRLQILFETLDYSTFKKYYPEGGPVATSCGPIDFGGRFSAGVIPSWCEYGDRGEIRCKFWFCRKILTRSEINSHRCVC